jgi:uncharacterized protein YecE (DUF72 family)
MPASRAKSVRIGCSGWAYPEWRGRLYPDGLPQRRWLARYAELFDTVEVNSTFYRLASPKAVADWVEQTPNGFLFTCKASRYLTHVRRLRDREKGTGLKEGMKRFYEPLAELKRTGRLGPTLWQLPANFHRDDERLEGALGALPNGRHAFEFRHPSWFTEAVYEILRGRNVALVIGDDPERPFQTRELTADWTFVRFHRGSMGRRGRYSKRELETWKRRIAAWRSRVEVFAYFNNDWEGFAVENARWLKEHLS